MIADTEIIKKLVDGDVTGWEIQKETGVSRNSISEMRKGKREISNLRLSSAIKLTEFAKKLTK